MSEVVAIFEVDPANISLKDMFCFCPIGVHHAPCLCAGNSQRWVVRGRCKQLVGLVYATVFSDS